MVANYTQFFCTNEQEVVRNLDNFLVNYVGWYRLDTISDVANSNRDYVWISDGEPDQAGNTNPRIIRVHGQGNSIRFSAYSTYINSSTYTGEIFDAIETVVTIGQDIRATVIADKERLLILLSNNASTSFAPAYVGRILSLYTVAQDPYPNAVRVSSSASEDWNESDLSLQWLALAPSGNQRPYELTTASGYIQTTGQCKRNNDFMAFSQILYTDDTIGDYELRGYPRGCYQVSDHFSHRSFLALSSGIHMVLRGSPGGNFESTSWAYGPLKDYRIADPFAIPDSGPVIDYRYRGFVTEGSTVSHWRPNTTVSGYLLHDLVQLSTLSGTSTSCPPLVRSPMGLAFDFNGTNQYLSGTGAYSYPTLSGSWTCELSINPDIIPSGVSPLIEFGAPGVGSANNTLLSIGITTSSGVIVSWQNELGTVISGTVSGPFISTDRWQYLAVRKNLVSSGVQNVDIWHAGFGDHLPVLRGSFTLNSNAADGSDSLWYVAATPELDKYYNGKIDEIRVSSTVRTYEEMLSSLRRVKL